MARLIDADVAQIYLNMEACEQIELMPTVDAVEVVRCKDCKYWNKLKDSLQGMCILSSNYPTGQWYCANGERREEE